MRVLFILLILSMSVPAQAADVVTLEINGVIGPATSDYISRSLDFASESGANLIIIRMDTPGGLDTAMRDIIKKIVASPVPIASFVHPSGSRAASAGTYILYASHIAAMAPATNLGAATPVQIGMPGGAPAPERSRKEDDEYEDEAATDEAPESSEQGSSRDDLSRKMVNDAVAYLRGLAKMRGRNEQWAEQSVRAAASLPAEDALERNVIDFIAADVDDLLRQLNGHSVNVLGQDVTLDTTSVTVEHIAPDWRSRLLAVISNPNIAYVLMLLGIYGLIFELANPGAVVPGTIGAICLLLALYAFQVLPINYTGFALIILGIGLMAAEAFAPSFGILGLGGIAAFLTGSLLLIDTDVPGLAIDPALIGAFAITSGVLFILALGMAFRARRARVVSGREELIGSIGVAIESFKETGSVRVHSEIWTATTDTPIAEGDRVIVKAMQGLTLQVTRLSNYSTPTDQPIDRR